MITISVCMIVKNEEAVLARCLDCLKGLYDEIVIVDTGSTDRTKDIAANYTDKIYDFVWTGSFSDARNFAFSKAEMEYIYSADADEVLDEENREQFLLLKQTMLPEIEIVQMYYGNQLQFGGTYNFDKEYRPKLFKRLRKFCWQEAIHEQIVLDPVVYESDVVIQHMPQSEHGDRDLLAFERICMSGERLSRRLHGIYARELFILGKSEHFQRAIPVFEQTFLDAERGAEEMAEAACVLAHAARISQDIKNFFRYVIRNTIGESCSEICYELGAFYEEEGELEEAAMWYYNAAYETEPVLNIHFGGDYPRKALAVCYARLGMEEEAEGFRKDCEAWKEEYQHNNTIW